MFPTTKRIILHEISDNSKDFLNKTVITNEDYLYTIDKTKIMKMHFTYRPPYLDSYNSSYGTYNTNKNCDAHLKIIDKTEMYIELLDLLKTGKCKVLFSINNCAITNYI